MAYNYFPNYPQPIYYQQQPQQQMSYAPQPQSGIIWVQGEAGAKAYPVAAGSNLLLMDSESECFYIKSTDASGMPMPLRTFEYKEVVRTQPTAQHSTAALPDMNQYTRREEFEALKEKVNQLSHDYSGEVNNVE